MYTEANPTVRDFKTNLKLNLTLTISKIGA